MNLAIDELPRQAVATVSPARTWTRRFVQLYVGLIIYGISAALQVQAGLGLDPWDVLHQGLAAKLGMQIGTLVIIVGFVVLLGWIPLRQRPGLGTISNAVLIGLSLNVSLGLIGQPHGLIGRWVMLLAGIALGGVATGMYISAGLGPGPRDGLMTGLARVSGRSIRLTRTMLEITVLATGFLLGGTVGIGTVLYALTIGPLAQFFLRLFCIPGIELHGRPVRAVDDVDLTGEPFGDDQY